MDADKPYHGDKLVNGFALLLEMVNTSYHILRENNLAQ